jgi:TRAP-type C4-dicarboxylate transport system substrate-binding protein
VRVRFGCRSWLRQGLYCRAAPSTSSGLRGLRLRVYNDATKRLAELSGATAVTIAAQDLGKAIETGQVDAMLTSSTTGVDSQAWKAMKFFTDMRAWIPKNMVCVSEKVWKGFSPAVQKSLLEAAKQAETQGWQLARSADETAKKQLADQRVQVVPPTADLRRTLDQLASAGREWAQKAGIPAPRPC